MNMEKFSHYFNIFKKNFLPNLSLIEFLFCAIILTNFLVILIGNIFIWIKMGIDDIEAALVVMIEVFLASVLMIMSGVVTVIIVSFFLNNVNNVLILKCNVIL